MNKNFDVLLRVPKGESFFFPGFEGGACQNQK